MDRTQDAVQVDEVLDWKDVINTFARQHDITARQTLKWISERTSLQVACEIFGVPLSPSIATRYTREDELTLCGLGDILHTAGLKVPRLMEHHRLKYKPREAERVGFSLSREEYLLERAAGKSKNRIAHEQGISGPALFHWLEKWNLKDAQLEAREIERLTSKSRTLPGTPDVGHKNAVITTSQLEQSTDLQGLVAVGSEESAEAKLPRTALIHKNFTAAPNSNCGDSAAAGAQPLLVSSQHHRDSPVDAPVSADIKVQLPVDIVIRLAIASEAMQSPTRDSSSAESISRSMRSRDDIMQDALTGLLDAMKLAYCELAEMLGEDVARQHIQNYASHQVNRFLSQLT